MKFKFSKEWCEKAAKVEQGVGGLMSCNPKYLKENQMKATKLTKEQKDCIQGKIKKVKGLAEVIKQQELFIEQVKMTHRFLKLYQGNPSDFELIIGKDIWDFYRFNEGLENPEWMWESIDELTYDIANNMKHFKVTANGIFESIHFSKSKNDKFKKGLDRILDYANNGEWHV